MLNMLFLAVSLLIYSTHCATAFFNHFLLGVQFLFWCDAIHFVEYFVWFSVVVSSSVPLTYAHKNFIHVLKCMKTGIFYDGGQRNTVNNARFLVGSFLFQFQYSEFGFCGGRLDSRYWIHFSKTE